MSEAPTILIIDDETGSRESMALALERTGVGVRTFDDARAALHHLEHQPGASLAICDLRMPGMDGLGFLEEVRKKELDLAVILVTGYGTIESAVEAMQVGADDYLTKPIDLYELRKRVMNLLENRMLKEEVSSLRQMLDKRFGFESIVGNSEPIERLFEQMTLVAPTRSTVLISGESGTGKELVAHALHQASPRREERFLALNCGAIPPDILESELFGHERGSFTGAVARKIGKFELAHRGTLFLDEISELYPELQVKLLRVLEERSFMRVGGAESIEVDYRLIAATNRDLEAEIARGRFREDLLYRLKVVSLRIPPLRERVGDIPLLAEHFLDRFCEEHGRQPKRLSPAAIEQLQSAAWPGNVRELKNTLESLVIFHQGDVIERGDLPADLRLASPAGSGTRIQSADGPVRTMAEIERQAILETLDLLGGHRAKTAKALGIGLRTLQRKLKEYRREESDSDPRGRRSRSFLSANAWGRAVLGHELRLAGSGWSRRSVAVRSS